MKERPKKYIRKPFKISLAIENDIVPTINKLIDRTNAVYSDDIQKEIPQYTKNAISFWLRTNGFVKPMGQNSKRWVRKDK